MKKIIAALLVSGAMASGSTMTSAKQGCSWSDADCFADGVDDVVNGTWAQPPVNRVTNELREKFGDGDPNTDGSRSGNGNTDGGRSVDR